MNSFRVPFVLYAENMPRISGRKFFAANNEEGQIEAWENVRSILEEIQAKDSERIASYLRRDSEEWNRLHAMG